MNDSTPSRIRVAAAANAAHSWLVPVALAVGVLLATQRVQDLDRAIADGRDLVRWLNAWETVWQLAADSAAAGIPSARGASRLSPDIVRIPSIEEGEFALWGAPWMLVEEWKRPELSVRVDLPDLLDEGVRPPAVALETGVGTEGSWGRRVLVYGRAPVHLSRVGVKRPDALGDVSVLWNSLAKSTWLVQAMSVSPYVYTQLGEGDWVREEWEPRTGATFHGHFLGLSSSCEFVPPTDPEAAGAAVGESRFGFCGSFRGSDQPMIIFIPVTAKREVVDIQSEISSALGRKRAGGSFAQVFPELTEYASEIGTMKLADVLGILEKERETRGDVIRVAGVPIPYRGPVILGSAAAAVLLLQLLLGMRLRELASYAPIILQLSADGWIGAQEGRLAAAATIGTAFVLPVASLGGGTVLVAFERWQPGIGGLAVLVCAASSYLARMGYEAYRAYRAKLARDSGSP